MKEVELMTENQYRYTHIHLCTYVLIYHAYVLKTEDALLKVTLIEV